MQKKYNTRLYLEYNGKCIEEYLNSNILPDKAYK